MPPRDRSISQATPWLALMLASSLLAGVSMAADGPGKPRSSTESTSAPAKLPIPEYSGGAVDPAGVGPVRYRQVPRGTRYQQAETILRNRGSEPNWYHYYRCAHHGYHPTHWCAWPPYWLSSRGPTPQHHPYDIIRSPKDDRDGAAGE